MMNDSTRRPSVLGGSMIISGTTIGAGMLALPTISAGMWVYWSLIIMLLIAALMLISSQALLEVNLHYKPGASFHTLVKETLGPKWSIVNGIAVAFVLYILIYAYVSGGGSIVQHTTSAIFNYQPSKLIAGLSFALVLSSCVWLSTWVVDRLSVVFMGGMIITFILSMSGMLTEIRTDILLEIGESDTGTTIFVWAALSTVLTSFCFHASVPSLVKYFGYQPKQINRCLVIGVGMALVCYLIWIIACYGVIGREGLKAVFAAGGNVGDLVAAAGSNLDGHYLLRVLEIFSSLAVASSFLGASLGLFDYMADLCKFDNTLIGRTKTTAVTFVPPTLGGLLWPDGFLLAIGWAGLAATLWSVIVPAMMLRASRAKHTPSDYRVKGGRLIVPSLLSLGVIVAISHALFVFGLLPVYR